MANRFWIDWDNLQRYNFVLFIVHIILTFVLFFYFRSINDPDRPPDFVNLDLYTHELKVAFENDTPQFFDVVSRKAADLDESSVTSLVVAFFAFTAGFHLLYAFNPNNIYLSAVKRGNNYLRWIEYSISATIMIVVIALLSGVKEIKAYFILVTSAVGMIMTGQFFETTEGPQKWIPVTVGFILLIGIWSVIISSFNDRLNEARDAGVEIPSWLFAVVYVLFFFYASFGFVPVAQGIFGGDYRMYEYAYLTLSLLSKATLGTLVGYGFGQRLQAEEPS